ncbi:MAG: hypothetical protein HZC17_01955 [Candidatus Omnitrophica bacterium]|nr:hypothetical protein [Candidatus Omnitrophota bacterium]
MAWRQKQMKWHHRISSVLQRHAALYTLAFAVSIGGVGAVKWYEAKASRQQQEEKNRKLTGAKNEIALADQEILAGNFDSAIAHLSEARKIIGTADAALRAGIQAKEELALVIKEYFQTGADVKDQAKSLPQDKLKQGANKLDQLAGTPEVSDWARFYAVVINLKLQDYDVSQMADYISSIVQDSNKILESKHSVIPVLAKSYFDQISVIPILTEDQVAKSYQAGEMFCKSSFSKTLSNFERGKLHRIIGELASRPGSKQPREVSRLHYDFAAGFFDQEIKSLVIKTHEDEARRQEMLWLEVMSLSQADLPIEKDLINSIVRPDPRLYEKEIFWLRYLLVHEKYEEFDNQLGKTLKTTPESDGFFLYLLQLQKIDFQYADKWILYRKLFEKFRSLGLTKEETAESKILAQLLFERNNRVIEFLSSNYEDAMSQIALIDSTKTKYEFAKIRVAVEFIFWMVIYNDLPLDYLQLDPAESVKDPRSYITCANEKLAFLAKIDISGIPEEQRAFFELMKTHANYFLGGQGPLYVPKTDSERGLVQLFRALKLRRESIVTAPFQQGYGLKLNPENVEKARKSFEEAGRFFYQEKDVVFRHFCELMVSEGKSLGVAPDVFKDIEIEKRLSPVIMEFNEIVLKQLIDRRSDLRQENKSLPVFFLVRDAKELRRVSKEYPGIWRDYRIGLLGWKHAPMSEMAAEDVKILMNLGHLKIYLRSIFSEGEVTQLKPDQVVFANSAFGSNWGEGVRRVKFDHDRFDSDEEYRSAYLASAFYLVNHGKGEGVFQYNATEQTFELLPAILVDLLSAWRAFKQVLIAA